MQGGQKSGTMFSEENIVKLFGREAAEDEDLQRFREFGLKGPVFEKANADLPLRIIVGHKGTGKSAILRLCRIDDDLNKIMAISIEPSDLIAAFPKGDGDFNAKVSAWKDALEATIGRIVVRSFGRKTDEATIVDKIKKFTGVLLDEIGEYFRENAEELLSGARAQAIRSYTNNKKIRVYIDDLDAGWHGTPQDIQRLSALLSAIRALSRDYPGLQFRIGFRTSVYYLIRTSDESTDKSDQSVVWVSWDNHEILAMLVKRIESFLGKNVDDLHLLTLRQDKLADYLKSIMSPVFSGAGKWENAPIHRVLLSLTRKRPRDLVKLCIEGARRAQELRINLITTECWRAIFEKYSKDRLQDTINEYKDELPSIANLLLEMRPYKKEKVTADMFVYHTDRLYAKLKDICGHATFYFTGQSRKATEHELAFFLYKINFLQARKTLEDGKIDRRYFEEQQYLSNSVIDFGYEWEVHPAYRWALQPDRLNQIFNELELR